MPQILDITNMIKISRKFVIFLFFVLRNKFSMCSVSAWSENKLQESAKNSYITVLVQMRFYIQELLMLIYLKEIKKKYLFI